jgi:hypothetical protein
LIDAIALKLINTTKVEREPYQRFVREIHFLRRHQDVADAKVSIDQGQKAWATDPEGRHGAPNCCCRPGRPASLDVRSVGGT